MEYMFVAVGCFILGMIYRGGGDKKSLDTQIMSLLKQGKRVIVCVNDDATIFELHGNRMKISKAVTSFNDDPVVLPIGEENELVSSNMDGSRSSESGNYNESGMAD